MRTRREDARSGSNVGPRLSPYPSRSLSRIGRCGRRRALRPGMGDNGVRAGNLSGRNSPAGKFRAHVQDAASIRAFGPKGRCGPGSNRPRCPADADGSADSRAVPAHFESTRQRAGSQTHGSRVPFRYHRAARPPGDWRCRPGRTGTNCGVVGHPLVHVDVDHALGLRQSARFPDVDRAQPEDQGLQHPVRTASCAGHGKRATSAADRAQLSCRLAENRGSVQGRHPSSRFDS